MLYLVNWNLKNRLLDYIAVVLCLFYVTSIINEFFVAILKVFQCTGCCRASLILWEFHITSYDGTPEA